MNQTHSAVGATRGHSGRVGTLLAVRHVDATHSARRLSVGRVRIIWTPSGSTVAAFDVSVGQDQVTLVAPEYCGSGATVLWARTHSTVGGTHSTVGPLASACARDAAGWGPAGRVSGPGMARAARVHYLRSVAKYSGWVWP